MKRKFYLFFFIIIASFIILIQINAHRPQKIVYGISNEPENLNPFLTQWIDFSPIFSQIFESLFFLDPDTGNPNPCLAESWERISDKAYLIHLKQGVLFHNGEELTSSDVHDTFLPYFQNREAIKDLEHSIAAELIERIEIQGKYKVIFFLKRIYSPFIKLLSNPLTAGILSSKSVYKFMNNGDFDPVGTGPFFLKEWTKGESILLERNQNYWKTVPKIKYIEFEPFEIWKRHNLIIEKQIDITSPVAGNYFRTLGENDIDIEKNIPQALAFIGFNNKKGPFSNINLRKAVLCAINRKKIVNYVNQGNALPAESPIPLGILGHSDELKQEEYNPSVAREYMRRSKIKGKIDIDFVVYSEFFFRGKGVFDIIIKQLSEVGFNVNQKTIDVWEDYDKYIKDGKADLFMDGLTNQFLDPDGILYPLFHSLSPNNLFHYSNPEVDELLIKGVKTFDYLEREKIYINIQNKLIRDTPCIFFHFSSPYFGVTPKIIDFKVTLLSLPDFREAYIQ